MILSVAVKLVVVPLLIPLRIVRVAVTVLGYTDTRREDGEEHARSE